MYVLLDKMKRASSIDSQISLKMSSSISFRTRICLGIFLVILLFSLIFIIVLILKEACLEFGKTNNRVFNRRSKGMLLAQLVTIIISILVLLLLFLLLTVIREKKDYVEALKVLAIVFLFLNLLTFFLMVFI